MTFGLWQRDWASIDYPDLPSVGNIEADRFEPARWKTEYPHPAFEQMDAADAFWAAGIAARFTDEMITAIVERGAFVRSAGVDYLTGVIIKRRNKVVAHWLTAINPLDRFEVYRNASGVTLTFDHAAQRLGLAPDDASYRISYATFDNTTGIEATAVPEVATMSREVRVPTAAWGPADGAGYRYAVASIRTVQAGYPNWAQPVRVTYEIARDASMWWRSIASAAMRAAARPTDDGAARDSGVGDLSARRVPHGAPLDRAEIHAVAVLKGKAQ